MKGQITKTVKPMTNKQAKELSKNFNMGLDGKGSKKTSTAKKGK